MAILNKQQESQVATNKIHVFWPAFVAIPGCSRTALAALGGVFIPEQRQGHRQAGRLTVHMLEIRHHHAGTHTRREAEGPA
jgi:hypothetical protein